MGTQTTSRAYVPRNCVWEITRGCTLRCVHCGSEAGARRRGELDTAECLDVIAQLAALGTEHITLSGGEPTLRPDWVTLAKAITDAGMFVNLVTNGQGDPERFAANAVTAGLANVGVSVDGLRATHDALRGEGTFERAMATVRAVAARGVWVDVMVTLHRENVLDIEGLYDELVAAGARGMRFQLAKPMGSLTARDDLTLRPAALLTLIPRLGRLSRRGALRVAVGDSIGYYGPDDRALRNPYGANVPWTGCHAGCEAIGIQSDGGVKGCLSLQPHAGEADPFVEGNVRELPLREIWERPGAFAYNRAWRVESLTGACARCEYARVCRGGARCVAHAYTRSLGCDPMCHHAAMREADAGSRWLAKTSARVATLCAALGVIGGCSSTSNGSTGDASTDLTATDTADVTMTDVTDVTDASVVDATDATDVRDVSDAADVSDASDAADVRDASDAADVSDASDAADVRDASDASDAADVRDASSDAIDCTRVCCACDYGILLPEVYAACCR